MLRYLLLTLLLITASAVKLNHQCIHDDIEHDIKVGQPGTSAYDTDHEGRLLATTYQNITMLVDNSTLTGVTTDFSNYVLNTIMPAVNNIVTAMLQVPQRTSTLTAGGYSTLCSGAVTVPSTYSKGVNADLVLFVRAVNDASSSYVASATACLLDTTTYRPTIGMMTYNTAYITSTTNSADIEANIVTTLHELTHVLGFSSSLYSYYINPSTGKILTGQKTTVTSGGYSTIVLNLASLTSRIQSYFGCTTATGAYLENQGTSASAGSHFERRIFYNDYMTASAILDTRISQFTLALLEGTGWYQVNYAMAEPMTWGKGKGCTFLTGSCFNSQTLKPNFAEFCPSLYVNQCSYTKRAGGACGSFSAQTDKTLPSAINWYKNYTSTQDTFSDNCPTILPYDNLDCEDSSLQSKAMISGEYFGYGSKCFMSTLYASGSLKSVYPYCFKATCSYSSSSGYSVLITVGTKVVTCTKAGTIAVSGYSGTITCPTPADYCSQIMTEGFCRRGCSSRGSCVSQTCDCVDGWTNFDCSIKQYVVGCSKCAYSGNSQLNTCYGDQCVCNPSNTKCTATGVTLIQTTPTGKITVVSSGTIISSSSSQEESTSGTAVEDIQVSVAEDSGAVTISSGGSTISSSSKKVSVLIPVLCSVFGFLGIIAFFSAFWYVRKLRQANKASQANPDNVKENGIGMKPQQFGTHNTPDNSPHRSPDYSPGCSPGKRQSSLNSSCHSDLGTVTNPSPVKERLYNPSLFQKRSKKVENKQDKADEPKEFAIQVSPLKKGSIELKDPEADDVNPEQKTAVSSINKVNNPGSKTSLPGSGKLDN